MMEESRYTIEKLPDGIRIIIPVENYLFSKIIGGVQLLFLPFLLGFLLLIFATVIANAQTYFSPYSNSIFMVLSVNLVVFVLITLLLLSASRMILTFLWHVAGKEIIDVIDGHPLMVRRDFRIMKLFHQYSYEEIHDLRLPKKSGVGFFFRNTQTQIYSMIRRKHGTIAFDYGKKTIYFGDDLEDTEANQIISILKEYLPTVLQS